MGEGGLQIIEEGEGEKKEVKKTCETTKSMGAAGG